MVLTQVYDVGAAFFQNDLNVDTDGRLHLVYWGDCALDLCDGPRLFEVNLVQDTGTRALVGEHRVYILPKSSVANNSVSCVYGGKQ